MGKTEINTTLKTDRAIEAENNARKLQLLRQIEFDLDDIMVMRSELFGLMGFAYGDLKVETKIVPTKQFMKKHCYELRGPDYGIYKVYLNDVYDYEGSEYDCYEWILKNCKQWQ